MNKLLKILCAGLCLAVGVQTVGCAFPFEPDDEEKGDNGGTETMTELDALQNYSKISTYLSPTGSCHDPAIIRVDNNYYLFGTNSTTKLQSNNLINWNFQGEIFNYNAAYYSTGTYVERYDGTRLVSCAKEMVDHVMSYYGNNPQFGETSGYWAPDIIKYGNEYRLYFCMSLFGKAQSCIGFATASNINGPYTYKGIVMKSSGYGSVNSYPNAIDPQIIVDKTGRMWMSYGSFFGGIYVVELDPASGFVKSGNGFTKGVWVTENPGTKICAGSCEGPFILYNAETDYYYLFVSYGDLNKNYNVRVGRSKNVTGPYTYSANDGLEMQKSGGNENNHGNKVLGGYNFGIEDTVSRMAPGHCSVLSDNGNYYMVNHVRNKGNSLNHYVQIHKIIFNEKGWPVVLPNTYAGETLQNIGTQNLVGSWKAINFMKTDFVMNNGVDNVQTAQSITVNSDKSVNGCLKGSVQMYEGGRVRLNVTNNDFGDDEAPFLGTFYGYVVSGYDFDNRKSTLFLSAMNDYGYTIVAEKVF